MLEPGPHRTRGFGLASVDEPSDLGIRVCFEVSVALCPTLLLSIEFTLLLSIEFLPSARTHLTILFIDIDLHLINSPSTSPLRVDLHLILLGRVHFSGQCDLPFA